MGKSVKKVIGTLGIIALVAITGGAALFAAAGFSISVSSVSTVVALSLGAISIGFGPELPTVDGARHLAENLSVSSSATAIRSVVFGRSGIAGQILFRKNIENSGDTPDELLLILGLAGYPCTSLEKFWFNDELVFDGDSTTGPGAITSGTFDGDLWVWFRTGDETSDAFADIATLSSEWDAKTRKLRGIPSIGIRLKVTEKVEGRLEPLAQIKGAKLYDPRLDSTVPGGSGSHDFDDPSTWAFSTNPKLAELLYLRGASVEGVRIFGMGKPAAAIDLENFASEANICEEQISVLGGGSIDRYSCNGLLVPGRDHRTNLRLLLSASAGTLDASEGIYRTFAGAWRSSSMTLTEADVDGAPSEIQLQQDPAREVNVIQGSFADPNDGWQVKEYPERRDQDSIDVVGENSVTLDLPFTTDHRIAQRIAKIEMYRANAPKHFAANYWLRTIPLQPGDIVTQTYARYALSSQTFRVAFWGLGAEDDRDGQRRLVVSMRLVEENQAWFSWDESTEEQSTTSITALPSVSRLPRLTTLNDVAVFEGSSPPANPKVGWLWLDTDVGIVFRWSGSAWVDYSTQVALSGAALLNSGAERNDLFGWTEVDGSWSINDAEPRFGTYHFQCASETGVLRLDNDSRLQVEPGERVLAMGFVQRTGSPGAEKRECRVRIEWRDSADSMISRSDGNRIDTVTYGLSRVIGIAPATAVSAIFLFQSPTTAGDAQGMRCDGAWMGIVSRGEDNIELAFAEPADGTLNVPTINVGAGGFFDTLVVDDVTWLNDTDETVDVIFDYTGLFALAAAEATISYFIHGRWDVGGSPTNDGDTDLKLTEIDPLHATRAGKLVISVADGETVTGEMCISVSAPPFTNLDPEDVEYKGVSLAIEVPKL